MSKSPNPSPVNAKQAQQHFYAFMEACGLDPRSSPHLTDTPVRFTKMVCEATKNYRKPPKLTTAAEYDATKELKVTAFEAKTDELVVIKDIEFSSICAHHFAPFMGKCHIGYIPNGKILGLSKFARITDYFCLRPQTQEILTEEIAEFVHRLTEAKFVGVMMEAQHTCMSCRGPRKMHSSTVTSKFMPSGQETTKAEFLRIVFRQ